MKHLKFMNWIQTEFSHENENIGVCLCIYTDQA